ncbi:hypothetical protein [Bacillus sp. FJAT-42376]|uniref:hypothetical protein n=1 Tax=Bacillus sp. FJAT-42376 TaxID=2014076 RepID=UPI0013DD9BC7|nr:hypothetical protein [Bacillus sp. FJAT-42376]
MLSENTVVVETEKDSSVFWMDYDGNGLVAISNDPRFSSKEEISRTLPKDIHADFFEYE